MKLKARWSCVGGSEILLDRQGRRIKRLSPNCRTIFKDEGYHFVPLICNALTLDKFHRRIAKSRLNWLLRRPFAAREATGGTIRKICG